MPRREKPAWQRFTAQATKDLDKMVQELLLWERYDPSDDETERLRLRIRNVQALIEEAETTLLPPSGWVG